MTLLALGNLQVSLGGRRVVADRAPRDVLTADRLRSVYGVNAHLEVAAGRLIVQPLSLVAPRLGVSGPIDDNKEGRIVA